MDSRGVAVMVIAVVSPRSRAAPGASLIEPVLRRHQRRPPWPRGDMRPRHEVWRALDVTKASSASILHGPACVAPFSVESARLIEESR